MLSENTTQIAQFIISNLRCAKCQESLVRNNYNSSTTFQYYYLKLLFEQDGREEKEIKFICDNCKQLLQREQKQDYQLLQEIHQNENTEVEIRFSADFSESRTSPQEAKIIPEVMHCEKCLLNQTTLVEFDQKLKSYVSQDPIKSIIVAEKLAKEQNEYDKRLFIQLQNTLEDNNASALQKALVLNKLIKIIKKYQKQQ